MQEFLAGSIRDEVTIRQIADGIKWDSGGRSAYRITNVLKQLGYIPVLERAGRWQARRRYWTPPGTSSDRRPRPRREHMTHKRETDCERRRGAGRD